LKTKTLQVAAFRPEAAREIVSPFRHRCLGSTNLAAH